MNNTLLSTLVLITLSGAAYAGGEPEFGDLFDLEQVSPADDGKEVAQPAPAPTQAPVLNSAHEKEGVKQPDPVPAAPQLREVAVDMFSDEPAPEAAMPEVETVVAADLFAPEPPAIKQNIVEDKMVIAVDVEPEAVEPGPVEAMVERRLLSGSSEEEIELFETALMRGESLSPDEVRAYKRHLDAIAKAKAEKPKGEPVSNTRSVAVSLAPGAPNPEIRVSDNYVTSVVILDSMGNPWPIKGYAVGNDEAFRTTAAGDNIILISPLKPYATGNMVITLKEKTVPVVFQLRNSPEQVDFRLEARVQAIGPESTYDPNMDLTMMPGGEDKILQSVLDGVPDNSLTELEVTGGSRYTQGWRDVSGAVYLRTPYKLKVPEVRKQSKSSDGTHVFVFDSTPVATLSVGGRPVLIDIKEKEF